MREACKLAEGTVDPITCVAVRDVEEQWPRDAPWGTPVVSGLHRGVEP